MFLSLVCLEVNWFFSGVVLYYVPTPTHVQKQSVLMAWFFLCEETLQWHLHFAFSSDKLMILHPESEPRSISIWDWRTQLFTCLLRPRKIIITEMSKQCRIKCKFVTRPAVQINRTFLILYLEITIPRNCNQTLTSDRETISPVQAGNNTIKADRDATLPERS